MTIHPLRFAALALALLAIGTALSAQGFGPGHGRGLRGLNLSETQQTQVKAIHDKHQAAFKAKGETARAAHKALFEAMQNAAMDAAALKTLHDKASAAQFDLLLEHRAARQEILPLLTAEQKAKFEKTPMGMGPRGGRGRGPGFSGPRHGGPAPEGPDAPPVKPS
ncbi:MAG: Spy/CpxP family protein refolding chaperone [Geothrix sp.]|uniref:Spy/CpxP family protein refolding chaperone n=1 Tax=Geothrix sp. TaxID=1962974 RepID=UPI001821F228|nr:Spy/CpxP family protein refolding chaperone [Geothrix sp.]NWJ41113.1 Spy/CpxP family protein refolding chaperone [Geothrix sp.]WIL20895.1 MAG: Spy/CpxP family protein refolding chaperone [Geothrix sp.]